MSEWTRVHVVRHGEVHNPDHVLYGRLPGFHLSVAGRAMARLVADELASADVVHVACSPLERARETAAPIAEAHELAPVVDERLIEAANVLEGRQVDRRTLADPRVWPHLRNPWRPSWGEPYTELAARMRAAVEAARDAARGHEAVCVSHQLPIVVLRRSLQGERLPHRPDRRECGLASITTVTYDGDVVRSVTYRDPAAHLASSSAQVPGA